MFQRCTELDSGFAPAWAALGRCHRVLGNTSRCPTPSRKPSAPSSARWRSIPICRVLHKYDAQLERDAGRAVAAMQRLLRRAQAAVDPEHFAGLVHACRYAGLLDASVAAHEEARRLDPTIQTSVLNTYALQNDWERIVREADAGRPRQPMHRAVPAGPQGGSHRRLATAPAPRRRR